MNLYGRYMIGTQAHSDFMNTLNIKGATGDQSNIRCNLILEVQKLKFLTITNSNR